MKLPSAFLLRSTTVSLLLVIALPAQAQRWESVRKGEYVMQLPDGAVIIDCKSWTWRKIGVPSSVTPIIKHHPAYVVCTQ